MLFIMLIKVTEKMRNSTQLLASKMLPIIAQAVDKERNITFTIGGNDKQHTDHQSRKSKRFGIPVEK